MSQTTAGKLLKGLYAAAVSGLGSLSAVLVGNTKVSDLTAGQWVTISLAALIALGGTFGLAAWSGPKVNGEKSG